MSGNNEMNTEENIVIKENDKGKDDENGVEKKEYNKELIELSMEEIQIMIAMNESLSSLDSYINNKQNEIKKNYQEYLEKATVCAESEELVIDNYYDNEDGDADEDGEDYDPSEDNEVFCYDVL